jgi:membrane protease YdiL (CAAX protease family)
MNVYSDLIHFLKNPNLQEDPNKGFIYRVSSFILLLFLCLVVSFTLSIFINSIYESGWIENDYHAFDDLKEFSDLKILFLASVAAPFIEESIFRAPLTAFKSPWKLYRKDPETGERILKDIRIPLFEHPRVFQVAFFVMAILFGYVHLFNYQIDTQILLFSPILVAPQMILGLIFGYIRIRFGFLWAVAMHACYNGFLVSLFLLAQNAVQ